MGKNFKNQEYPVSATDVNKPNQELAKMLSGEYKSLKS